MSGVSFLIIMECWPRWNGCANVGIEFVVGTRPEITKVASVLRAFRLHRGFPAIVLCTGQQIELVRASLADPAVRDATSPIWLHELPATGDGRWRREALVGLRLRWQRHRPVAAVSVGDTASALLSAEVASSLAIPVIHLEAGVRLPCASGQRHATEPEEVIRRRLTKLATFHFAPSDQEAANLIREGVSKTQVFIAGDLSAAAVHTFAANSVDMLASTQSVLVTVGLDHDLADDLSEAGFVLATFHRPSSLQNSGSLSEWIATLSRQIKPRFILLCSRPDTRWAAFYDRLRHIHRVVIAPAPPPSAFQMLLRRTTCALTDSAGVQQEALLLGKRVLVTRSCVELYGDHQNLVYAEPPFREVTSAHIAACAGCDDWQMASAHGAEIGVGIVRTMTELVERVGF